MISRFFDIIIRTLMVIAVIPLVIVAATLSYIIHGNESRR